MKSLGCIIMSSLVVFLVATFTSWAAPPSEDCGQVDNGMGETVASISDCMDQLLTAQSDMIDAVEEVVIGMQGMNLSSFGVERFGMRQSVMEEDLMPNIQFLRDEHGRAMAANKAVDDADYDEIVIGFVFIETLANAEGNPRCVLVARKLL